MNLLQIVILALIQGAAELLPISSSAHVIMAERLMGLDPSSPELTFLLVMLHTGTMFAVLCYFWPRWRPLLRARPPNADEKSETGWHFLQMVILATACTGVVALGLMVLIENVIQTRLLGHPKGEVEDLFKDRWLIAVALFAVGIFIIVAGFRTVKTESSVLTGRTSMFIGIVQGLCLPFRGFSRSGATISTALCRDVSRSLAESFSFALAVVMTPPVIVRELRRLLKAKDWQGGQELMDLLQPGLLGMVCSFVAGLLALWLLSAVLEKGRWKYFGFYCLGAALVVAGAATLGY